MTTDQDHKDQRHKRHTAERTDTTRTGDLDAARLAVSMAKISMRLVPDQDPNTIADLFQKYVEDNAPKGSVFRATFASRLTTWWQGSPLASTMSRPVFRVVPHMCVKPRKSKTSGLPSPRCFRFSAA